MMTPKREKKEEFCCVMASGYGSGEAGGVDQVSGTDGGKGSSWAFL
jgi:hypothetical protein